MFFGRFERRFEKRAAFASFGPTKPQNLATRSNRRRASMFNDSRNRLKFQEAPPIFSKIPRFSSFFFVGVVFFLLFDDIFIKM